MNKLMNRAGLLAAAFALALAVALALNAATQPPAAGQTLAPTQTPTPTPTADANASVIGSDTDGDGLIEITTRAQFNAMRYDLDGNGSPDDTSITTAYTDYLTCNQSNTSGATPCKGYELGDNISLASYADWDPIPGLESVFNGNGFKISGLKTNIGLFGQVGVNGVVKNVDVVGARIELEEDDKIQAGVFATTNRGTIIGSYASGDVILKASSTKFGSIGGLVGRNFGTIAASVADVDLTVYSDIPAGKRQRVGGVVGINYGRIHGSYAYGDVIDARASGDRGFHARGFAVNHTDKEGEIHWSFSYGNKIVKRGSSGTKSLARFAYNIVDNGHGGLVTKSCALDSESKFTFDDCPTPTPTPTPTSTPTSTPTPTPTLTPTPTPTD